MIRLATPALALGLGLLACDPTPANPPQAAQTSAQTTHQQPSAGPESASPHLAAAQAELPALTAQVAERHGLIAAELTVTLTPDLQLKATHKNESCVLAVPDGVVAAELITNVDHTLDRCVRQLLGR